MVYKLVSILLLLSVIICSSNCERIDRNNSNTFVLVNPRQVHRLEKTIRYFFSKLGKPINKPIVLRSTSLQANDVQSTIREICDSIRERLMQFANDCGLTNTVRRYQHSFNDNSLSEDWYSEMLLQSIHLIRDVGNIINEISSSVDRYLGGRNATSRRSKKLTKQANSFEFLGVVHDAAEFSERLAQCLLEMANARNHRSFDLSRSILNLMKHPPKTTLGTLKSTVNSVSYHDAFNNQARQSPWHIFLCLSMMNSEEISYDDCVREFQHLDACTNSMKQRSNSEVYNVDSKSWTKAIRRLSDCKIQTDKYGKVEVSCKTARRMPRDVKRKTRYVFERMLDKKISKGTPFHRAVNDLGDTLSESELGQRFIDELCQYISIYEDGRKKLLRFSKYSDRDKRAAARHREVSEALETYKKGVLRRTFGAIDKMHHFTVDYEKFFAEGMKDTLKEAWQGHVRVLSCLMDWMTKLLELHSGENFSGKEPSSSDTSTSLVEWNGDENSNSENMQEFGALRSRSEILKDVDSSMNGLMESMNRLSRHRSANNNNMLTCIANNLLLVTMFMQTIGFVSSLYCFGQTASDQTSTEFEDEWNRVRRSVLPLDHSQIIDLVSHDYLFLKLYENVTDPF